MRTQRSGSRLNAPAFAAAAVTTLILLAGCTSAGDDGDTPPEAGETITLKIGDVNSLTGGLAQTGLQSVCAARVLVDAINNDGFVPGVAIDYTVEDDQSTPATAVQAATKLTNEGYNFITGGITGSMVQPRVPITNDAGAYDSLGLIQSLVVVESANITVHPGPVGPQSGKAVAEIVRQLNAETVAYINVDSDYGNSSTAAAKDAIGSTAEELGTVVVPPTDTNLADEATKIASLDPDVIVSFLAGGPQIVDFYTRIKAIKPTVDIVAGPGTLTPDFVVAAGEAAEGVYTANTYPPAESNSANDALIEQWETYGPDHSECDNQRINSSGATAWANIYLIALGAAEAESDDPATVRDALVGSAWTIPAGEDVMIGANGQADTPFYAFVVEEGELVPASFD